uniref:MAM domain-containing protein n=1 Tax=Panagrolaimus superbus TaxID=310955 RepID=A0A914Z545_9BILA
MLGGNTAGGNKNTTTNHYAYYSSKKPITENVAMVVSPYYQHSSHSCSITFRYRIIGGPGASIIVSTQLIPLHAISSEETTEEEAADWVNPTVRKIIPSTKSEAILTNIGIGEVGYPTRIRIECHSGESKNTNIITECFIDDIRLTQCEEHIWQPNVCSMDSQPKRYLCHKFAEQKCIDFADVCDMHDDCPNREDEDNTIHNCIQNVGDKKN